MSTDCWLLLSLMHLISSPRLLNQVFLTDITNSIIVKIHKSPLLLALESAEFEEMSELAPLILQSVLELGQP